MRQHITLQAPTFIQMREKYHIAQYCHTCIESESLVTFKSPLLYFIKILLEFSKVYICLFCECSCVCLCGKTFPQSTLYTHIPFQLQQRQVKMSVYHFPGKMFYYSHRFHFDFRPCIALQSWQCTWLTRAGAHHSLFLFVPIYIFLSPTRPTSTHHVSLSLSLHYWGVVVFFLHIISGKRVFVGIFFQHSF